MAKYTLRLSKRAEKQLDKLTDNIAAPIITAIEKLADNPRPHGYIKLTRKNGYRIRVGDYRVIYEIFDKVLIVDVVEIGNRKEIYD